MLKRSLEAFAKPLATKAVMQPCFVSHAMTHALLVVDDMQYCLAAHLHWAPGENVPHEENRAHTFGNLCYELLQLAAAYGTRSVCIDESVAIFLSTHRYESIQCVFFIGLTLVFPGL